MKLIKIGNQYYNVLQEFEITFLEKEYEYIILQDDEIIYFPHHSWWGNRIYWTIEEVLDKIKNIESISYRNTNLKKSRLLHFNTVLQYMTDYVRDHKIEKIISEPFVWQFA